MDPRAALALQGLGPHGDVDDQQGSAGKTQDGATSSSCAATSRISRDPASAVRRADQPRGARFVYRVAGGKVRSVGVARR